MRTIETTARVGPDHTLTVRVPADVPLGEHRVVVVIDNAMTAPVRAGASFPLPAHDAGLVPPDRSLRREDIYGDDGR